jgi:nitric-oxide synthase, bacterial
MGRDHVRGAGGLANRLRRLSRLDRLDEAQAFLALHARETGAGPEALARRWASVRRDLIRHGHYDHSKEELAFGARVAWRNHARCIGRLFWDSLVVRDRRDIAEPAAIFDDMRGHLGLAQGDGRIRSVLTVYPPARGDRMPAHAESGQLVQYAGYLERGGVLGDRRAVEATRVAQSLGWTPPPTRGRFDILPFLMRDGDGRRHLFEVPRAEVREVAIAHDGFPRLGALGLRWYAVPLVTDMVLSIGGIDYPCAPFNGFYVCTEIASRNLADRGRYDLLPEIARCLGLDPGGAERLWRDTALTELNRAVLASFEAAGVTMLDHHTASDQFMRFCAREGAAGRKVSADWAWLVPPQASGACEVFHLDTRDLRTVPNFYRNRSTDGAGLRPGGGCPVSPLRRALSRLRRGVGHD